MRIFLAIAPPEATSSRLYTARAALRNAWEGVRWVKSGDYHITLEFLGERDEALVESLKAAITGIACDFKAMQIETAGAGFFGPPARPKVFIEKVTAELEGFFSLRRLLRSALEPLTGWESRPYRPHITLGRAGRNPSGPFAGGLLPSGVKMDNVEPFRARELVLFQSVLQSDGARYSRLESWPLKETS